LTPEQLAKAQDYAAQHNIPFDNIEDRQKLLTRDDMIALVDQFCEEK